MDEKPDYIDISEKPKRAPKPGSWASMNAIQRTGVIGFFPLFMLSLFCDGRLGMGFGLVAWSWIFLGYVAGNLWRFRHAVHFWWSVSFAAVAHCSLIPAYMRLIPQIKSDGSAGKAYMYLAFGLMIAEVLVLLFVLKKVAMWIHRRIHNPSSPEQGGLV